MNYNFNTKSMRDFQPCFVYSPTLFSSYHQDIIRPILSGVITSDGQYPERFTFQDVMDFNVSDSSFISQPREKVFHKDCVLSSDSRVIIYVHGWQNQPGDALQTYRHLYKQFYSDPKVLDLIDGKIANFIGFMWNSNTTYRHSLRRARNAALQLEILIKYLQDELGFTDIGLVGHSQGAYLIMYMLSKDYEKAQCGGNHIKPLSGVVLQGADVLKRKTKANRIFGSYVFNKTKRLSAFISDHDRILGLSIFARPNIRVGRRGFHSKADGRCKTFDVSHNPITNKKMRHGSYKQDKYVQLETHEFIFDPCYEMHKMYYVMTDN